MTHEAPDYERTVHGSPGSVAGTDTGFPPAPSAPLPPPVPAPPAPPAPQGKSDEDASGTDAAKASAQAAKQSAGEVAQTASGGAKDVATETKQQARNVLGEARTQLKTQAAHQHRSAVTNLRSLGDELSSMAQHGENSGPATDLVSQAGERTHGVASWLEAREPDQILDEVRSFARRRPGTFLVAALVGGVLAGRLTRGVVAAHSDDSGDSDDSADSDRSGDAADDIGSVISPQPTLQAPPVSGPVASPVPSLGDQRTESGGFRS